MHTSYKRKIIKYNDILLKRKRKLFLMTKFIKKLISRCLSFSKDELGYLGDKNYPIFVTIEVTSFYTLS